ncbi:MAG: ATP-dependent RecD-like DNA helicase [Clostridia bacterium]|nr:ATP-dependent RecD-like DNA helicase [Clostridia bacterium]
MKLEGKITNIIYKNESNGYTVMLINTEDDYITVVGETAGVEEGDTVELEGELIYHKTYGEQLAFTNINKVLPKDTDALIKYIANSDIKGVGVKTAEKMVDLFGDNVIEVVKNEPYKLTQIKGINEEKAYAISEYINDEWEKWNCVNFLSKYGVSITIASKIYDSLGLGAIDIIKENPYALLDFVSALNFKIVDELGKNLNIKYNNEDRVKSGILYALYEIMGMGHTCIEEHILLDYASKLLEISNEDISNGLISLSMQDKVTLEKREDGEFVYRKSIYKAENNIAQYIILKNKQVRYKASYKKEIEYASQKQSLVLSETQEEAIRTCLNNPISVITGGPGTGKTTIIRCIIDILEKEDKSYVLCAPTGRAAKRITETTGEEAKTLHRLLEITKIEDRDLDKLIDYETVILEEDVVIVDEVSMVDTILMNNLIKALKPETKLILVGDAYQLPSVGPGSVLKDIIDSKVIDVVELNEIYRQSATSEIILNAHKVKKGEYIEFRKNDTDLFFVEANSVEETKEKLELLLSQRLEGFQNLNVMEDVQVITPIKKTALGTFELNRTIQKILNPETNSKNIRKLGDKIFQEGDKVMQTKNNYDISYDIDGTRMTGVYNGDIGTIKKIDSVNKIIIVKFDDGKEVPYEFEMLEQLDHAYAITVHKSQGSEFKAVLIPLYICYEKLFNRNLVYTAMTRAKDLLIFVGNKRAINYMIDNTYENVRRTGLKNRLLEVN